MGQAKRNPPWYDQRRRNNLALRSAPYYVATFDRLFLRAWNRDQLLPGRYKITVAQVGTDPEKWAAQPDLGSAADPWQSATAPALMARIEATFEVRLEEWVQVDPPKGLQQPKITEIHAEFRQAIEDERAKLPRRIMGQKSGL